MERLDQDELVAEITNSLARRHSTATVLFHHALAERLGVGPTDHKCLDLLRERAPMTASELAAITGLTTGAIAGVVARLERSGWLLREPHPRDGRKQVLYVTEEAVRDVGAVFAGLADDAAGLLAGFDTHELSAIAEFLVRATDFAYRRTALLRGQSLSGLGRSSTPPVATTQKESR